MHGVIFTELKKYVDARVGQDAWGKLTADAGLGNKIYMPIQSYPDEDAAALVSTAAQLTGNSTAGILEDFGSFIAPALLRMYRSLVPSTWTVLDLIENTEDVIHRVVRLKSPGASPPRLACTRPGPDEVVMTYDSPRRLCALARGMARGMAEHYGEPVTITESTCMHRGDSACTISIKRVA